MMKKLLFTLMLFAFAKICLAQIAADGDYRSATTGDWSSPASWQIRSGGSWSAASVAPTAINNVYIQSGHAITVDVNNAYCKDLQLNITGVLAIGAKTVNVNGKIRAYSGAADITSNDGDYTGTSSTALTSTMITTSGVGVLKFVGGTRNITNSGEWNSSGTGNAAEFALDAGATGTLNTVGVKFNPIVFSSGTVTTDAFISVSTGNLTIKSGAKLISSRSSTSNTTTNIIGNSSSAPAGTVTIDEGGILELTGNSPRMSCNEFVNNGTVIYSNSGSQTLLQLATVSGTNGTATFNNYSTLIFANTGNKTLSLPTTVSKLLQFTGDVSVIPTATNTLTMANNSTIDRTVISTAGSSISSANSAFIKFGSLSTDIVNVNIGATISSSYEVPSIQTPGKLGTLTIANGVTYTFTGSRSVTNLVNNGTIVLTPSTSLTFTIGGTASGTGTILSNLSTGNVAATPSIPEYYSASLAFTNSGSKGTIYLDPSKKELRFLTLTGAGALTLGNSITLNSPFTLSDNTTIALGTAANVSFAASQAASWTSGKTLTITGWTGTAGTSGTAGKLFFGSTTSNLTAQQISQIAFNISGTNYGAMLLSDGELVPTNTVLPVKLTSFAATKQGAAVQLKWSTASEQNNARFDVQRSTDGQSFTTIGSKAGAGNSNTVLNYFFTDYTPLSGVNYYRLNQLDLDGKSTLSNPVAIDFGFELTNMVVYTAINPSTLNVNIKAEKASTGKFVVYNIAGQKMLEKVVSLNSGNNEMGINLPDLRKGIYVATYQNGSQLLTQKFIR